MATGFLQIAAFRFWYVLSNQMLQKPNPHNCRDWNFALEGITLCNLSPGADAYGPRQTWYCERAANAVVSSFLGRIG
jgi:hypothetical protein